MAIGGDSQLAVGGDALVIVSQSADVVVGSEMRITTEELGMYADESRRADASSVKYWSSKNSRNWRSNFTRKFVKLLWRMWRSYSAETSGSSLLFVSTGQVVRSRILHLRTHICSEIVRAAIG